MKLLENPIVKDVSEELKRLLLAAVLINDEQADTMNLVFDLDEYLIEKDYLNKTNSVNIFLDDVREVRVSFTAEIAASIMDVHDTVTIQHSDYSSEELFVMAGGPDFPKVQFVLPNRLIYEENLGQVLEELNEGASYYLEVKIIDSYLRAVSDGYLSSVRKDMATVKEFIKAAAAYNKLLKTGAIATYQFIDDVNSINENFDQEDFIEDYLLEGFEARHNGILAAAAFYAASKELPFLQEVKIFEEVFERLKKLEG